MINIKKDIKLSMRDLVDIYDFVALLVVAVFFILIVPSADYFISDPDGGYFLEGALQVFRGGEVPQVDFYASYGPLNFIFRAGVMKLFGISLFSEFIYVTVGYTIAYTLIFWTVRRFILSQGAAWTVLLLALIAHPRYYKFFVILIPALTIFSAYLYLKLRSLGALFLMGVVICISFLFRHDFGVYAAISEIVLIASLRDIHIQKRIGIILTLGAFTFICLLPWGIWLIFQGALGEYITNLIQVTFEQSDKMSLPHPLLHWKGSLSVLYLCFYGELLILLGALLIQWKHIEVNYRPLLNAIAIMALFTLLQSAFRSDYPHLLQGVGSIFIAIGVYWNIDWKNIRIQNIWRALAIVPMLVAAYVLIDDYHQLLNLTKGNVGENIKFVKTDRSQMYLDDGKVSVQDKGKYMMLTLMRGCTGHDEKVVVYPFAPQLAFFADRLIGSDTLAIAPGYYNTEANQDRAIKAIERDNVRLVLWDESKNFDSIPDRNSTVTHPIIHAFITQNFDKKLNYEGWVVYVRKGIDPIFGESKLCSPLGL